jgi:PAS domain S-box-containing protein
MANKSRTSRVLIADDSVILNNMLKDVFEEEGFDVVQAFDGAECKSAFLKQSPDLALIDIQMPRTDGIEALRFIKSKSPETLVVLMTGVGNEETAVRAMKLGADEYLTKPFGMSEVVSLTRRLIDTRRSREENLRLKKKIRQGEKYLAHLTTIINEAIVTTDARGRIQFVNGAVARMWGYSPEELRDKDIHFLVRGEAKTLLYRDLVKDTIKTGKIEGEFYFRKKDKGSFPGYLSTSVIEEGGRPIGIVAVVADLSRLSEIERRLKQSEKLASLGKVVEGIAHEVRNCLTSLGGFALRLQKVTAGDPTCHRYTSVILDDVARLESMVKEIESYVRFSKFYTFRFVKTDLVAVIERSRDKVMRKLPEALVQSVSFRLQADQAPSRIDADPEALEEVFYNIILNAYEAMPRGGRITVTIKNLKSAVSVRLTDTGVGIYSEDLKDIFNPFFTSKTTGAGMGLSKVYLLVEEHRGTIDVSSEPGKGTTVDLLLPSERLMMPMYPRESLASEDSSEGRQTGAPSEEGGEGHGHN